MAPRRSARSSTRSGTPSATAFPDDAFVPAVTRVRSRSTSRTGTTRRIGATSKPRPRRSPRSTTRSSRPGSTCSSTPPTRRWRSTVPRKARHLDDPKAHLAASMAVLNDVLADLPPEKIRYHVCWGNYRGPAPQGRGSQADILDVVLTPRAVHLRRGRQPSPEHEWELWRDVTLPDDKNLIVGVVDTKTNHVEHPSSSRSGCSASPTSSARSGRRGHGLRLRHLRRLPSLRAVDRVAETRRAVRSARVASTALGRLEAVVASSVARRPARGGRRWCAGCARRVRRPAASASWPSTASSIARCSPLMSRVEHHRGIVESRRSPAPHRRSLRAHRQRRRPAGPASTPDGRAVDVEALSEGLFSADPQAVYARWVEFRPGRASSRRRPADRAGEPARRGPPPGPGVRDRAELRRHAAESGFTVPRADRSLFTKCVSSLTGPTGEITSRPATSIGRSSWSLSWAAGCTELSEDQAWDHVAGLTVGQDSRDRITQFAAATAVRPGQVLSRLLADRAVARHPRRVRRSGRPRPRLRRQRRGRPEGPHERHGVRRRRTWSRGSPPCCPCYRGT